MGFIKGGLPAPSRLGHAPQPEARHTHRIRPQQPTYTLLVIQVLFTETEPSGKFSLKRETKTLFLH